MSVAAKHVEMTSNLYSLKDADVNRFTNRVMHAEAGISKLEASRLSDHAVNTSIEGIESFLCVGMVGAYN
jgi:hypothetical protein